MLLHDSSPVGDILLHDSVFVVDSITCQVSLVTSNPKSDKVDCENAVSEKEEATSEDVNAVLLSSFKASDSEVHDSLEVGDI
jgi:hypothetical protein